MKKNLDRDYRLVNAQISDKQFDQLESNLLRIDPNNDYFNQKLFLPSLGKGRKDGFLEKLLPDTRLVVAPKIDGCAVALSYLDGKLKKAISRKGEDVTKAIRTVVNIPKSISIRSTLHVRGELFGRCLSPANSRRLASGLFRKRDPHGQGLSFCSFQILNGELNYFSSLQVLERLGFEIPETEFTKHISDVEHFRILWSEGRLFTNYPTAGMVITVNSRKLQKQLNNHYSTCLDWQYVIKD